VVDTNCLFTEAADRILSHPAEEVIQDTISSESPEVKWYIPEIVVAERKFQMRQRALILLKSVERLETLLGHKLGINEEILEQRIELAISRQLEPLGVRRLEIDTAKVDWEDIIERAGTRKPPFEAEKEKGFRDALILESFSQLATKLPKSSTTTRIILVTQDALLGAAFGDKFSGHSNVRMEPNMDSLLSLVNTLRSEISEQDVQKLLPRAQQLFYEKGNKSSFYYKGEIWKKIREKFGDILSSVPDASYVLGDNTGLHLGAQTFVKKDAQKLYFGVKLTSTIEALKYEYNTEIGRVHPSLFSPHKVSDVNALASLTTGVGGPGEPSSALLQKWSGASLNPAYNPLSFGPAGMANPASGLSFLPSPVPEFKEIKRTGQNVFEVSWAATLTTRQTLIRPTLVEIRHLETTWA